MQPKPKRRPRVGVPWRTTTDEKAGKRQSYEHYLYAIRKAGGDPVEISLLLTPGKLERLTETLDGFVLPGSPADVNPKRYRRRPHEKTAKADSKREYTDIAILKHAFASGKPALAICYGAQLLNVHLGGTLVQDIPSKNGKVKHERDQGGPETFHAVRLKARQFSKLAGKATVHVNSSHHQSILDPGRGLRIAARAADGVIEAVEWIGGPGWVTGVQWHPERMRGDAFADALFRRLVAEARKAADSR